MSNLPEDVIASMADERKRLLSEIERLKEVVLKNERQRITAENALEKVTRPQRWQVIGVNVHPADIELKIREGILQPLVSTYYIDELQTAIVDRNYIKDYVQQELIRLIGSAIIKAVGIDVHQDNKTGMTMHSVRVIAGMNNANDELRKVTP